MRQRARQGKWNGGVVLGYKSIKGARMMSNQENSTLEIVPEKAIVVRRIIELYASGKELRAISNITKGTGQSMGMPIVRQPLRKSS